MREEPDLAAILRAAWLGRRMIVKGGLYGIAAGILFMLLAVPHYRAVMLVAPVTRAATADLAGPLPDNAGYGTEYMLKSFAAGDTADFTWFEQVARQPRVAGTMLREAGIAQGVAADRSFRLASHRAPDNAEDFSAYLQDRVAIEPVGSTVLRRVTYDHPDRAFAVRFLHALYADTDRMIRDDMRARADRRIAWLQNTIAATQNPDDRRAMAALLTAQQQLRIALSMDEPYAARLAEPPAASVHRVWPRAPLILPVFAFIGALLGAAMALWRKRPL